MGITATADRPAGRVFLPPPPSSLPQGDPAAGPRGVRRGGGDDGSECVKEGGKEVWTPSGPPDCSVYLAVSGRGAPSLFLYLQRPSSIEGSVPRLRFPNATTLVG